MAAKNGDFHFICSIKIIDPGISLQNTCLPTHTQISSHQANISNSAVAFPIFLFLAISLVIFTTPSFVIKTGQNKRKSFDLIHSCFQKVFQSLQYIVFTIITNSPLWFCVYSLKCCVSMQKCPWCEHIL